MKQQVNVLILCAWRSAAFEAVTFEPVQRSSASFGSLIRPPGPTLVAIPFFLNKYATCEGTSPVGPREMTAGTGAIDPVRMSAGRACRL